MRVHLSSLSNQGSNLQTRTNTFVPQICEFIIIHSFLAKVYIGDSMYFAEESMGLVK